MTLTLTVKNEAFDRPAFKISVDSLDNVGIIKSKALAEAQRLHPEDDMVNNLVNLQTTSLVAPVIANHVIVANLVEKLKLSTDTPFTFVFRSGSPGGQKLPGMSSLSLINIQHEYYLIFKRESALNAFIALVYSSFRCPHFL